MVYMKILTENAPYYKTRLNETQSVEESLKEQPKEKAARDSTQKTRFYNLLFYSSKILVLLSV